MKVVGEGQVEYYGALLRDFELDIHELDLPFQPPFHVLRFY